MKNFKETIITIIRILGFIGLGYGSAGIVVGEYPMVSAIVLCLTIVITFDYFKQN